MADTPHQHIGGTGRIPALDALRCLALGLVLYRHVASNYPGLSLPVHLAELDIGQIGVSVFCVLSGFLALGGRRRPLPWLKARLARVFPSLWLVTGISALGAWLTGYKPVIPGDLAIQALGLGYFIPPELRLNVVVWFITLILACYAVALPVRALGGRPGAALAALGGSAALLVLVPDTLTTHLFSFALGMGARAALSAGLPPPALWALPIATLAACIPDARFGYGAIAALLLLGARAMPSAGPPRSVAWVARNSYEIFLVHGLVLVALAHVLALPPAATVPLLLGGSALAAPALKRCTDWAAQAARHRARPLQSS